MKLTNIQIYTLRRMLKGTRYSLRGDTKKALEHRSRVCFTPNDVSSPSIPVLFRMGLVAFSSVTIRDKSRFYSVRLTSTGETLARTIQTVDNA